MATEITTWAELAAINSALSGDYVLMNDLDSTSPGYDTYAGSSANAGAGWIPISTFTGQFNGQYHTISGLRIYRDANYSGLFGYIGGGSVQNVILNDYYCETTSGYAGSIAGAVQNHGSISNCGCKSGQLKAGGNFIGGLVGYLYSYVAIQESYTACDVRYTGGYVKGNTAGGLVGFVHSFCTITDCYAVGNVTGSYYVASLTGALDFHANVTRCYGKGHVSSSISPNVRKGLNAFSEEGSGTTDCFWDTQTTGQTSSVGGTGKTTAQMQDISTFSTWDISAVANTDARDTTHVWNIVDDSSYPFLSSEVAPIAPSDDDPGDDPGEIVKSVTSNIFGNIIKPIM